VKSFWSNLTGCWLSVNGLKKKKGRPAQVKNGTQQKAKCRPKKDGKAIDSGRKIASVRTGKQEGGSRWERGLPCEKTVREPRGSVSPNGDLTTCWIEEKTEPGNSHSKGFHCEIPGSGGGGKDTPWWGGGELVDSGNVSLGADGLPEAPEKPAQRPRT